MLTQSARDSEPRVNYDFVFAVGVLAIAGAIAQNEKSIYKQQPGININGLKVPNTAAANNTRKPAPSAAAKAPKASAAAKAGGSERKSERKASE
jgi:hypothetical protein